MSTTNPNLLNQILSTSWTERSEALEQVLRLPATQLKDLLTSLDPSLKNPVLEQLTAQNLRWPESKQLELLTFCWEFSESLRPALAELALKLPPRKGRDFSLWLLEHGQGWELSLALENLHRYGSMAINAPLAQILQNIEAQSADIQKTVVGILKQKPLRRYLRIVADKLKSHDPEVLHLCLQLLSAWAPRLDLPWKAIARMVLLAPTGVNPKEALKVFEASGRTDILHYLGHKPLESQHPLFEQICTLLSKRANPKLCTILLQTLLHTQDPEKFQFLVHCFEHIPSVLKAKCIRQILPRTKSHQDVLIKLLGACRQIQDIPLFKQHLAQNKDAKLRYESIQALVKYNDTQIDQYLLQEIEADQTTSIHLTMAMVEKLNTERNWVYQELLHREYPSADTCKQMILRALAYSKELSLDPLLLADVEKFLHHPHPSTRLFSVQILGQNAKQNTLEKLLELALNEEAYDVEYALIEALKKLIGMNYQGLSSWKDRGPAELKLCLQLLLSSSLGTHKIIEYLDLWLKPLPSFTHKWQLLLPLCHAESPQENLLFWTLKALNQVPADEYTPLLPELTGLAVHTVQHDHAPEIWQYFCQIDSALQIKFIPIFRHTKTLTKELLTFWTETPDPDLKDQTQAIILQLAVKNHG